MNYRGLLNSQEDKERGSLKNSLMLCILNWVQLYLEKRIFLFFSPINGGLHCIGKEQSANRSNLYLLMTKVVCSSIFYLHANDDFIIKKRKIILVSVTFLIFPAHWEKCVGLPYYYNFQNSSWFHLLLDGSWYVFENLSVSWKCLVMV